MNVNDRLKILIELLGLNLKEFSRRTNIPYQSLLNYLSSKRSPTLENLQKIAIHLNCNLNWLLTGEGEPFIKKDPSLDPRRQAIIKIISDMPEDKLDDIYKMLEKEKLLLELLEERKKIKKTG